MEDHLKSSPDFTDERAFVEIEDAVTLFRDADNYTCNYLALWDDDGMNNVVDQWWGHFGSKRARLVALDMSLKLNLNLEASLAFPDSFTSLLQTNSGKYLLV